MSKRLQIQVPDEMADAWREAAELSGVSLSAWVTMRTNRPDCRALLTQVMAKVDQLSKPHPLPGPQFNEEERWIIVTLQHEWATLTGRSLTAEQVARIAVRMAGSAVGRPEKEITEVCGDE